MKLTTWIIALGAFGAFARLDAQGTDSAQPATGSTTTRVDAHAARSSRAVVNTQRDDPFYTTNRIDWPGPNEYRLSTGEPGSAYWQQRADYTIHATLDTAAKRVTGAVTVHYTNNSPDTLRFVWMQLDQNLFRTGSDGSVLFAADSGGGYALSDVKVDGASVAPTIQGTMMRVDLPSPLAPQGGTLTIAIAYSFLVPQHGSDRMGRDGTLYGIAQWYPRMAVYDDVRGWNTDPYLGQGEFYLEYGDIDYAVTVPAGYTVAGSGVLQNPREVLSATERARLLRASKATEVIPIITDAEAVARPMPGTKTWRFRAERVRDVAWSAAPDFRWDATSWNGVLCQAYYQIAKAHKSWESAAEMTQWTIRQYSELVYPYPYPQATTVTGTLTGMEYPMFVMVPYGTDDPQSIFGVLNHEQGHEWFPMIVGSNERLYAWMDEGINTYMNAFANDARYPGTTSWDTNVALWKALVDTKQDRSPLMTAPDHTTEEAYDVIGYRKPATVLLTLRDNVVGRETMDRAMREYVRRWAFKHPTPGDFFRTIENVSGHDLSWFWRGFFYSTDVLDLGIDNVANSEQDGAQVAVVTLSKNTSIPFPIFMRLALANGTTQDVHLPVDIWSRGNVFKATVPVKSAVVGARLWPDGVVPDWNSANDVWGTPPAAADLTAKGHGATSGGLNATSVQ